MAKLDDQVPTGQLQSGQGFGPKRVENGPEQHTEGTDPENNADNGDDALFTDLKIMLNANELTEADISDAEWDAIKDNWRKYVVGGDDKDLTNAVVAQKIKAIENSCKSAWNADEKVSEEDNNDGQ